MSQKKKAKAFRLLTNQYKTTFLVSVLAASAEADRTLLPLDEKIRASVVLACFTGIGAFTLGSFSKKSMPTGCCFLLTKMALKPQGFCTVFKIL